MHFLHINSEKDVNQIDKHIKKGNNVLSDVTDSGVKGVKINVNKALMYLAFFNNSFFPLSAKNI